MNAIAKNQVEAFQQGFAATIPQIKAVLPKHISFEKFERVAMLAVQLEPRLLQCEMKSLFLELQKCAADGLLPDRKEAVITFRWNNKKGCNVAVYQPMIAGVKKLARNSGEVRSFTAQVVYEGEIFRHVLGDDERIEHERRLECVDDNKIVAAYAIVTLTNGDKIRESMSIAEIEKARNTNKDWAKGPWATWRGEMCRKTVGHRLSKSIPRSTDKPESDRFHSALERVTSESMIDGIATSQPTQAPVSGGKLAMLEGMIGSTFEEEEGAPESTDPELPRAQEFIALLADQKTEAEVRNAMSNKAVQRTMAKWQQEKPALFKLVDDAVVARLAQYAPADNAPEHDAAA